MGVVAQVLRVCFCFNLLLALLLSAFICKLLQLSPCLSQRTREGWSVMATQLGFGLALLLSPWIWITAQPDTSEQFAAIQRALDDDDPRPVFLLGNHTSFFDTLLTVAKAPSRVIYHARTYQASYLTNIPLLGTMIAAMGHFPVHFTGTADTDFRVDREAMAATERSVDAFLDEGNSALAFFPEGALNSTPAEIKPFRYGGIKKALARDARLFQFVTHGCPDVWPKGFPPKVWPGLPSNVRYGVQPLAPNGAKALVAELRAAPGVDDETADHQLLAVHLQGKMQALYSTLEAAGADKAD